LVNFGEAVNFPLILGLMLALFGAATLVHLLVVSVSRRRHEMGLLKALGFVNRQVGAAVCWQATTVALVGIVIGVPLGVATGGLVWRTFASNLGAVPVSTVPAWLIAALGVGVLVVANLLALAPAWAAARSKTSGQLLRTQSRARRPFASIARATSSSFSPSRATSAILEKSADKRTAVALPMPELAPVTIATDSIIEVSWMRYSFIIWLGRIRAY
jgi:predicted lysophospholipase L1 biosynthesis ABC-type transport system permease subunit